MEALLKSEVLRAQLEWQKNTDTALAEHTAHRQKLTLEIAQHSKRWWEEKQARAEEVNALRCEHQEAIRCVRAQNTQLLQLMMQPEATVLGGTATSAAALEDGLLDVAHGDVESLTAQVVALSVQERESALENKRLMKERAEA